MDLLLELDRPVRYIVLTTHAYEHKVFVPSFQRRFPLAQVYHSPKCVFLLHPTASACHNKRLSLAGLTDSSRMPQRLSPGASLLLPQMRPLLPKEGTLCQCLPRPPVGFSSLD